MRKIYLFIGFFLASWLTTTLCTAQTIGSLKVTDVAVAPVVSKGENPVYYYILSAATQMVPNDKAGIPDTYFPMFEKNIVLVNASQTETNYKAHAAQFTNNEQFQLVNEGGALKLKNRATGGYMVNSWGSSATGETFQNILIPNSTKQYLLKTGGRSPLWIKYTDQELIANRYNYNGGGAQNAEKTTAWYFLPASAISTQLFLKLNEAELLKNSLSIGVHPGQLSQATFDDYVNTLQQIRSSTEQTEATLQLIKTAITKVTTEVILPKAGEAYYIKSASQPYDNRGYFLSVDEQGNVTSSEKDIVGNASSIWEMKGTDAALKMVNKATNQQIQPVSNGNTAFAMGETNVPITFNYLGEGQFNLQSGNIVYHRSATATRSLFNYKGGRNSASSWLIYKADDSYYKEGLLSLITDAEALQGNTLIGTHPGEAPQAAHTALTTAIAKAKATTLNYKEAFNALTLSLKTFKDSKVTLLLSTPEKEQLYYVISASTTTYCKGMAMNGAPEGVQMNFVTKSFNPTMIWKFIDRGNGKVAIQNKATGLYIAENAEKGTSKTPADYSVIDLDYQGQYHLKCGTLAPLHCQANGSLIVNWEAGINSASVWRFEALTPAEMTAEVAISNLSAKQGRTSTGIGNKEATLLSVNVAVQGLLGETTLKSMTYNLNGTTQKSDVKKIKLYQTNTDYRFRLKEATLLATSTPIEGSITTTFDTPLPLQSGNNYFWLTCDVADDAKEGNLIDAQIVSCVDGTGKTILSSEGNPAFAATIFTTQATVLTCGDWGSKYYRIPAIITANDGSLIAVTDRRISSNTDLPAHVDVDVNRSTDNGKTWSAPLIVAGDDPTAIGYGDAAILKNKNGRLLLLYNGGPRGLFNSSENDPFRKYKIHSDDNGITWSKPIDITKQLYATGCADPIAAKWTSMLLTSGVGICTRDGVLMVAVAAAVPGQNGFSDFAAVSYDNGDTWKVESTQTAWKSGDEAKLVELNNGDIMISMRRGGGRQINTSPDKGKTWRTSYLNDQLKSPACNGEILRYTSTLDGFKKNRILHSLPYASNRSNVSVMLSYDEGINYNVRKTICPGPSAYSALTILPNGNIGCYFEDGGENMDMVFVSFTLDWLTNGADKFESATVGMQEVSANDLKVWSENGKIKTNRPDTLPNVYELSGIQQNPENKLQKGIYHVKVGKEVRSILIK
ncbi:MAG: exo-alpha-sialidase [Bacteroidaceae bacterium]